MTAVGWLGLGAMGAPMAACLARSGRLVRAYDIAPERAVALAGTVYRLRRAWPTRPGTPA